MMLQRILSLLLLAPCLAVFGGTAGVQGHAAKPTMKLHAQPAMAFTPARIVVTAELRNVTSEDAEFYCPAVEWDWGDGTLSASSSDCGPFEPATSEVATRYVKSHVYDVPGRFRVQLRLRRGTSTILSGSTSVTVRGGTPYGGQ